MMFDAIDCVPAPVYGYVLGICLCIGGVLSYLPQYYSLIKSGQSTGIHEFSILLLNVGSACLAANSFILNYWKFECYDQCSFWLCSGNLLSMFQIWIGWISVLPLYLIFLRFKIRESEKRVLNDIIYGLIYIMFIFIMIIVGVTEKSISSDSKAFFRISAQVLGIISAICSFFVWIPQIYELLKTQEQGSLSLLMFIIQTPGNLVIIILQVLYQQSWTTWITYLVIFVEQAAIVIILLVFKYRERRMRRELHDVMDNSFMDDEINDVFT